MKVLRSIDLRHNLVVITGDHGESMGEDGVFRHTTRMSEIQMRVPCVIVGAGWNHAKYLQPLCTWIFCRRCCMCSAAEIWPSGTVKEEI